MSSFKAVSANFLLSLFTFTISTTGSSKVATWSSYLTLVSNFKIIEMANIIIIEALKKPDKRKNSSRWLYL